MKMNSGLKARDKLRFGPSFELGLSPSFENTRPLRAGFPDGGGMKNNVGIVSDPIFQKHLTGYHHPERPSRLAAIVEALSAAKLLTQDNLIKPRPAMIQEIAYCHTPEYIKIVEEECEHARALGINDGSYTLITGDAQLCPDSYEIALLAAGGVINAVDEVVKGNFRSAYCLVRPPGHHACSNRGMGFCLFNNVAIGARYALKRLGLKRALIVDWDVHHGNGTQEIFESDPSIFYFSTHQWPLYPGTGAESEKGIGNILNCPIAGGNRSRVEVLNAFQTDLIQEMQRFQPEIIFISAGFDAHYMDPLGGFNLTEQDFGELTRLVMKLAHTYAKDRIVSVLEGGYDLNALALCSIEHVRGLQI